MIELISLFTFIIVAIIVYKYDSYAQKGKIEFDILSDRL